MIRSTRSPALALAVLFGLFSMVMLMDPAQLTHDAPAQVYAPLQPRSAS
jgi:hypothetical protein